LPFEALLRATTKHRLEPSIDRRFPVGAFREAFDYREHGGHFGKVVLTFNGILPAGGPGEWAAC
jgi:NADPH:quinone reductase-like Zn-dependent oxidoreductase